MSEVLSGDSNLVVSVSVNLQGILAPDLGRIQYSCSDAVNSSPSGAGHFKQNKNILGCDCVGLQY